GRLDVLFSSRRRHTGWPRDWSADVCSSDLMIRPAHVWIVPDMPKPRSGKIMRRVLAAVSSGQDAGDVSTLANPEVVEELRRMVRSEERRVGKQGRSRWGTKRKESMIVP